MAEPFEMNPNLPFQDGVSSNYTTNTMGMLNPGYDIPFSTMPDYSTLRGSDSQQAMSGRAELEYDSINDPQMGLSTIL